MAVVAEEMASKKTVGRSRDDAGNAKKKKMLLPR